LKKKLANLKLEGIWDYARSCEEIGYLKPNPEPFRDLISFFALDPGEILYVGNNYAYDIIGAKSQGLITAHITRRFFAGSAADFSFSDYRRLGDWVLSLA
jgi:putative hydrolase of the HAD superfamily